VSDSSINLEEKLSRVAEHWRPKIICELNDYEVKVAKFKGDFVWHQHDDTDELFLCLQGELLIELRDGSPTGLARPRSPGSCHFNIGLQEWVR
jgi:mannose-6-phosphate isomerase-like protein (cupin superfamily)